MCDIPTSRYMQITNFHGLLKRISAGFFAKQTGDTKDDPGERLMHLKDCYGCSGLQTPEQL
jgi:hypothetical protein